MGHFDIVASRSQREWRARGLLRPNLHGVDSLQIRVARARACCHDGAERQRQRFRPAPLQRPAKIAVRKRTQQLHAAVPVIAATITIM